MRISIKGKKISREVVIVKIYFIKYIFILFVFNTVGLPTLANFLILCACKARYLKVVTSQR